VLAGRPAAIDRNLAYGDVLDAWNYYLQHDNQGRGVVLIGHSQGSMVLTELIKREIDGKPIQKQLVSALLLGTSLPVPRDKDVGGAFQQVPLCRNSKQIGCVITYVSFRANAPPPANSRFAKVAGQDLIAGCTESGGTKRWQWRIACLTFQRTRKRNIRCSGCRVQWSKDAPTIDTPFVSVPGNG
jgi:pimeloyl-ACP methyl ester carboxylesterase